MRCQHTKFLIGAHATLDLPYVNADQKQIPQDHVDIFNVCELLVVHFHHTRRYIQNHEYFKSISKVLHK